MRWSIIRVIWLRELRDQLRDRRTVFMIVVLPLLLYPAAGFGLIQLAMGFLKKQMTVGIWGAENLPRWEARFEPSISAASWWAITPPGPGVPLGGIERAAAALALKRAEQSDYPPFLIRQGAKARLNPQFLDADEDGSLVVKLYNPLPPGKTVPNAETKGTGSNLPEALRQVDTTPIQTKEIDLLLIVPPDFTSSLERNGRPPLYVLTREGDDRSRLVDNRVATALARWKKRLKEVRLLRLGVPPGIDEPFEVVDPERAKPTSKRAAEDLLEILVRIFPFVLVMWSLAGALYPAVDLCAGEKERGTMETLLISPASREEIVWGKFLTIWVFSAATALLNLVSMGVTTWHFSSFLTTDAVNPPSPFWGVALLLPLSAFFSAICLAVGAYARSSKEGQYYLMPLFLVTLPLVFLTLAPGVELNAFYSMVPVTGVALLLQKLLATGTPDGALWLYFVPVLVPMVIYGWLALRWAIEQFKREEVLFREAERLDLGLWLRRLFRDKELLPSVGQAVFCFGLILFLRWISFGFGHSLPLLVRTGVGYLAFVAAPPLFMTLMLTRWPRQGIALRRPPAWSIPVAVLLAILVLPPLAELTLGVLHQFPALKEVLDERHPLTEELRALTIGHDYTFGQRALYFLILAVLPAVCEEIAFRGFILTALRRRFRPWTAILLSSFLFGLYVMNVFQFVNHLALGIVLGLLVTRSGSLIPAIVFHFVFNTLVVGPEVFPGSFTVFGYPEGSLADFALVRALLAVGCVLLAGGLVAILSILGVKPTMDFPVPGQTPEDLPPELPPVAPSAAARSVPERVSP
jgi:sodium transport system permease protein